MRRSLLVVMLLAALAGCGTSGGGGGAVGVLNRLSSFPDDNGNGYPEIPPPDGVDETELVAFEITNQITMSQAEQLANVNIPDFVSNIVTIRARLTVNLTYPGDITDRLTGSRGIAPFELRGEVACPSTMEVRVSVVADIPLMGEQTVQSFGPYTFNRDTGENAYQCNSILSIETFVDENGQANATVDVTPMN